MATAEETNLDYLETEEQDDEESQDVQFEITSYPADFTVRVLYEKWQAQQIVIPDFQRRYVWNRVQASRFIESFLLGLPTPQIFLYRERRSSRFLVVDGQQRLGTIARFYQGQFSDTQPFRLRGVHQRWEGRAYDALGEDDRLALDDSTLRSVVIRQLQPEDDSSVYPIFERLNTGGTQLNPMEIRKAISPGEGYNLLDRLNQDANWRALIGMEKVDQRLKDVELVLRVLALSDGWREYTKPMKKFIGGYMNRLKKMPAEELAAREQRFKFACEKARSTESEKPFHLAKGRLNIAVMDSILATMIELAESLTDDLPKAYAKLVNDPDYIGSMEVNTSDTAAVRQRFGKAHDYFQS